MSDLSPPRLLVVACGALARELVAMVRENSFDNITVECLPPELHNHPDRIPDAVRARVESAAPDYDRVLVGYGDCGTGGRLDDLCADLGAERLPGAHCYEFFAGRETFAALHDREPGTFYLTDFLVRNFDRLVVRALGLDRFPELHETYFGNYRRLVHLAQSEDSGLEERGRRAAEQLGLEHELVRTGLGDLARTVSEAAGSAARAGAGR